MFAVFLCVIICSLNIPQQMFVKDKILQKHVIAFKEMLSHQSFFNFYKPTLKIC